MSDENKIEDSEKEVFDEERLDTLESIADKSEQERSDELEPVTDDDVQEEESAEEVVDEPEEMAEDEDVEEEEQSIEITIDGKVQKIPVSEISRRLQEANDLKKPAPKEPEGPSILELAEERFGKAKRAYAKAVISVDEDEIEKTQNELFEAQNELFQAKYQPPNIDEIKQSAVREMTMKNLLDRLNSPVESGGQADIFNDERARMLADFEARKLINGGADPLSWDTYEKAGKTVRKFLGWDTSGFEEKRKKKEKMIDIKQAHAKVPKKSNEDKPMTYEQTVAEGMAELKKARGSI